MNLLTNNVTQKNKIADKTTTHEIDQEFDKITSSLNIGDRIDSTERKPAFITLKDQKDNFKNNQKVILGTPQKLNLAK